MNIHLNSDDHEVILTYFTSVQRQNGYQGPCFINVDRLSEIHMAYAELITSSYMAKLRVLHLNLVKTDLDNKTAFLEGILNSIKKE